MLTIGLIDNYPVVQTGLCVLISSHFKALTLIRADSSSNVLKEHGAIKPDLIILGINNLEMAASIRTAAESKSQFPLVPVIVYDQNAHKGISAYYFRLGIKGHILKQCVSTEVINCINAVLKGKFYVAKTLQKILPDEWLKNPTSELPMENLIKLAPRQREVASHLIQGKSTKVIAGLLNRRPSTISSIKKQIFSKMDVSNILELAALFNHNNEMANSVKH